MQQKWASFRDKETTNCCVLVLASIYLNQEVWWYNGSPLALLSTPKLQERVMWKSRFLCNSLRDLAGLQQYCQWLRNQRECFWHDWVPSWAQLFKGAFPLKVGLKSLGEGICPSSFQPASWWNKAGSLRVRKRTVVWMFMLLPIWTTWRPTRENQLPWGP